MSTNKDDYNHLGLTDSEVLQSREKNGINLLTPPKRPSLWKLYLEKFEDPVVRVLLVAAVFSLIISIIENEYAETIGIIAAILLATGIGFFFEYDANKKFDLLNAVNEETLVKVIRNGRVQEVPRKDIVVGDIVILETGEEIPADGELVEAISLQVNESNLTGEPVINKTIIEADFDEEATYASNLVMRGTTVVDGHGTMRVLHVGDATEIGKVARQSTEENLEPTPLNIQLTKLANLIGKIGFTVAGLAFLIFFVKDVLLYFDFGALNGWHEWLPVFERTLKYFMMAVTLIVVAVPEGLPMSVTLSLALNMRRMLSTNNLVRKMHACETMGAITVICTDKTGTLTQNRMTVRKLYTGGEVIDAKDADFRDPLQEPLLRTALLCSDAVISGDTEIGDPTETALVRLGETNGFDEDLVRNRWPRLTEIPFDSDRKMMSTVHKLAGGLMLVTKGATDVLLDRCVVTPEERARIEQVNEQFSNEGLRVLAFACRSVDGPAITLADENSLTFLGLIAMMDPPREESKAAVAECIRAGIRPIMITGDHKITAAAIAREIGILRDGTEAVEGAVIDGMSDEELQDFVPKVSVYARVSPEHKIRIVRAWQQRGNLVAMTGDGVNDAPALKQADIGVAMGITGTEVAKDAAGMVLADDNFATIVKAVKNGRNVYANIKRAIQFLLSGNTAGILTVLYASLMGLPVPFAAVHLLFINLLTDSLPAIALGMEPHTNEVMSEKPRPRNEGILTKPFLYSVGVEGLVIAAATVTAFYLGLNAGGAAAGQTMAFSTLCLSRLFHGFSCKSQHPVLLTRHFWNNRALLGAFTIGALLLGLVLLVPALEPLFAVAPLSIGMVGAIVGLAFGSMLVIQLLKWIRR